MNVHYSSEKHTWETPQDFFNKLNNIFNFTLDACAEWHTAKVPCYYTKEQDALKTNLQTAVLGHSKTHKNHFSFKTTKNH